jgi:hypothetical protein
MTNEKLIEINKVKNEMGGIETQIKNINLLITSCGLTARISGTPKGSFRRTEIEFSYDNKEMLIGILVNERSKLEKKLVELNEQFEQL